MPTISSLQIPPPANWQDFETLCCDLWRKIWNDPNTQKNGRQGQPQHGVDIYGRPDQGDSCAGVQCKGKDNYLKKTLGQSEVKAEVEKAKSFEPKLSQFIIATTGSKDATIEELARKITEEHISNGLFSVHVWGWKDIVNRLADFTELLEKHFPELSISTRAIKKEIDDIKKATQAILESEEGIRSDVASLPEKIGVAKIANYPDLSTSILTPEYQAELDHSRDLLNKNEPKEALEFLEKLKSRIWTDSPGIVKYRLLTNIGSAKLIFDQEQEAAQLFLEALQYNPEDEKALGNAALGYMLLGQTEKANIFANKVLDKNPANSLAHSIIMQISPDDEKLEDIIAKVPEPYRNTPSVAYGFSYLLRKRNKLSESIKWLEIAVENDEEDLPDLKGALGEILIQSIIEDQSVSYGNQLNDEQKEQIKEAIDLLSLAWNRISETGLRNLRLTWIVNRGLAKRVLGHLEEAIKDVEIALEAEPFNPKFKKLRSLLAIECNETGKATTLLEEILTTKEIPETPLLLAVALRKENKFPKAISILNELIESNPPKELKDEANRLLIQLYIDTNALENAIKISDYMRGSDPANIFNLIDAARILRFSGKSTGSISLLNEARGYINDSSSFREQMDLANEFYSINQFEDAASIYDKIIDKSLDTPLTHMLVNSYYRSGEIGKALDICKNLRQKYGPLKHITELESAIYEEIGDLPNAKKVCQEYLSAFPDDLEMKLRLAVVNLRCSDFEDLDEFLNSSIDTSVLSLEHGFQLSYLYVARNSAQRAFEIMYEIRRKFFNNGDAHLKYIGFFFQRGREEEDWLNVSEVQVDTAVCIEDDAGQKEWYIIEGRRDADMQRREINLEHPLTKKLLGKSVNDEVLIKESHISKEFGKIVETKSKYVHALHESLSLFEKLFPKTPGLWGVKIEQTEKQGDLPKGFQTILDEVSRQHETHQQVEQFYKEGKLTIGALANLIGRDVLAVWDGIIRTSDLGLKCCLGSVEERDQAISLLYDKPKVIVDIISLMTLHGINSDDIMIKAFGKFGIAQSTIELLTGIIEDRKTFRAEGFMTIGKEGDKFVKQEISSEDVRRNVEYLESITNWIDGNCNVIPVKAALNIKRDRKKRLEEMMGSSFIDTILIASEPANVLYSDDERLRSLAKNEFNVDGLWTQILLIHCLNNNILEKNKYDEMIVKLVCSHYYHTSIDADVLIEAARQSKWTSSEPYKTVLQVLRGKSSDDYSALIVATNFLYELWKQPIMPCQRDFLVLSLLDAITSERNQNAVLDRLISNIKRRFFLLPLAEQRILSLIESSNKYILV